MMIITLLVIIMNRTNLGNCGKQVSVLKYKGGNECSSALVEVPINSNSPTISLHHEITYCGSYYFRFLRKSVLMAIEPDIILLIRHFENKDGNVMDGNVLYHGLYYKFYFHNQTVTPESWQYVCLAISSSMIKIVWNGEILLNKPKVDASKGKIKAMKIWLGGAIFSNKIKYKRFEGMIANANYWKNALQDDYLIAITTNKTVSISANYDLLSCTIPKNSSCMDYLVLDENDVLFQGSHPENLLVEYKTDFDSSNYLCKGYGGNLTLPKNEEDLKTLGYLRQQSEVCPSFFLGLKKSADDEILDLKDNIVPYLKWNLNEPNGKETQKCIFAYDTYLYDTECVNKRCFICHIPEKSMFILRGPIPRDTERKYFVIMNRKLTEIRGLAETECFWNEGKWNFGMNLKLDNVTNNMPPVGLRDWNNGEKLKFTQCKKDEFTCYMYGHCIPMNKRCDGHPDCSVDGSDENDCKIMILGKGYQKKHPPTKNTTSLVSIEVYDITHIKELDLSYTIHFKVTMKWFDSRIIFKNLKPNDYENQMDDLEIDEIWTPTLYIENSNNIYIKSKQQKEDVEVAVKVHRYGSAEQNELSEIDEDYLYPGNENPISLANYFQIKLACKFDLKW